MHLIEVIETARDKSGKMWVEIARELNRHPTCVWRWRCGSTRIPKYFRNRFETAIGSQIDWDTYALQFAAINRPPPAPAPAPAPPKPTPPKPAFAAFFEQLGQE